MKKCLIGCVIAAALTIGSSAGTGIGKVDNVLNVKDTMISASALGNHPNGLYYVRETFSVKQSNKTYTYKKGTYVSVYNLRIGGSTGVKVTTQLENGTLQFVRR